jgi:hypothetical protein
VSKPRSDELDRVDALLESMATRIQRPLAAGADASELPALERDFGGSRRLSARERLDIYRQQFWLRHEESLEEDFPATSQLLGSAWQSVVEGYLLENPPSTPSLRELGFRLPDYLASLGSGGGRGVVLDMARLELAYLEVFDAVDEPPLALAELESLGPADWSGARLELSRALRLLELQHSVADFRRAVRSGETISAPSAGPPIHLVVYRHELGLWDQEISADAYDFLQRLAHGESLGAACEGTAGRSPGASEELDAHLGEWFTNWTRLGWITKVVVQGANAAL